MRPCGGEKLVQRKLVLLGDGTCGKTSLLNVFTKGFFPTVYEPTIFENYVHDIYVDNIHMELSLFDTAGQEECDRLRSLCYDDTEAIMLCFSVDNRDSLENAGTRWINEIAERVQGDFKIVLVALKCDLREENEKEELNDEAQAEDSDTRPETEETGKKKDKTIQYHEGLEVAKKIGALRYLECSALRNRGVNEAFTEAARVALQVKLPSKASTGKTCELM